jgi:hypothetical protein
MCVSYEPYLDIDELGEVRASAQLGRQLLDLLLQLFHPSHSSTSHKHTKTLSTIQTATRPSALEQDTKALSTHPLSTPSSTPSPCPLFRLSLVSPHLSCHPSRSAAPCSSALSHRRLASWANI